MEHMVKFVVTLILIFTLFTLILFSVNKVYEMMAINKNAVCKKHFGNDYMYVSGDRSPNLCVSLGGGVYYYESIPKEER